MLFFFLHLYKLMYFFFLCFHEVLPFLKISHLPDSINGSRARPKKYILFLSWELESAAQNDKCGKKSTCTLLQHML